MTFHIGTGIWLNEPKTWSSNGETLEFLTDARTDFWRNTHYGFVRDNGHFLASRPAAVSPQQCG